MTGTVCSWLKLKQFMAGNIDRDIVAAYSCCIRTYIHIGSSVIEVQCVCVLWNEVFACH